MAISRRSGRGEDDEGAPRPPKPVRPIVPPSVPPMVAPVVRPVAPGVPPTVAPVVMPVSPAHAPARGGGKASSGSGRKASEEEIPRGARGGRGPVKSGASLASKVGLGSAFAALVITAAAVFTSGGASAESGGGSLDETGTLLARAIASTDPAIWVGGGNTSRPQSPLEQARKVVEKLFGSTGGDWWSETTKKVSEPNFSKMDPDEQKAATEALNRYVAAKEELEQPAADTSGPVKAGEEMLRRLVNAANQAQGGRARLYGAWVRSWSADFSKEGDWVASTTDRATIQYDASKGRTLSSGALQIPGQMTVSGTAVPVGIYTATNTLRAGKPLMAYVALYDVGGGSGGSGGSPLKYVWLLLAPLLVGGLAYAIAGSHTKHLKDLARELDRLGTSGDPGRAVRAHGAEAGSIARAVERMVGNIEFRSQHGSADLEEIVEKERKVAEEIHGGLMAKNPPRLLDYEVETLFKPGFEIAGDHFEYFRIDQDHLGVILLDTNVRGIPAALVMSATKAYVKAAAPQQLSPAEVLRQVNRNLAGDLPPGRHVTALYAVIDTKEGKATVSSAGHLPLLVYRHAAGKVAKINPEGIALGLDVGPVFDRALQEGDVAIGVGDRIVLYTDGSLKVQNETGEEFGEQRFYQAVAKNAPMNSQAFVNFVGSAIDQFHLTTPQNDDITISTVKRLK